MNINLKTSKAFYWKLQFKNVYDIDITEHILNLIFLFLLITNTFKVMINHGFAYTCSMNTSTVAHAINQNYFIYIQ